MNATFDPSWNSKRNFHAELRVCARMGHYCRVSSSRWVVATLSLLAVAACSSTTVHPAAKPFSSVLAAACVVPNPPAARQVSSPAGGAASNGRFTRGVTLDAGNLAISPPPKTARPAISAKLAECNLRAALTDEGFPVEYEIQLGGLTFGLATVSVRDSLLTGHSTMQGISGTGLPHPPKLHPYHQRLAWVAITQPSIVSSCPSMPSQPVHSTPTPTPKVPKLPGFQVLVIDANTGADGLDYAAARNENCFAGIQTPSLTPAVEDVSIPWTLVSRNPDNYSGTINIAVRSCDGYESGGAYNVSRDTPGLLTTEIQRPFNACGTPRRQAVKLQAPTVTSTLPSVLVHARLGAVDKSPWAS